MSGKIVVSLACIKEFQNKIRNFDNTAINSYNSIKCLYADCITIANGLAEDSQRSLDKSNRVLNDANAKYNSLSSQLASLKTQLQSTSPTITRTTTDSDGNSTTHVETNPEYSRLQNRIATVELKVSKVQSVISRTRKLSGEIMDEIKKLTNCMSEFNDQNAETATLFKQLNVNNKKAVQKLEKIYSAVSGYLGVNVFKPNSWF